MLMALINETLASITPASLKFTLTRNTDRTHPLITHQNHLHPNHYAVAGSQYVDSIVEEVNRRLEVNELPNCSFVCIILLFVLK